MTREDFYDWRREERKIDFLADYRVVRKYFCARHDLSASEIEMLWKLHSLGKFIKNDYEITRGIHPWDPKRFQFYMDNGWIKVWRQRKPSIGQNYKIYEVTRKCKMMVEEFYKIMCKEIPIPTDLKKNPIMKRETYTDKVYAHAILNFNKAMENLRE